MRLATLIWAYYGSHVFEQVHLLQSGLIRRRIMNDPASATYSDVTLSPVEDDLDTDKLELFRATEATRHPAEQARLKAAAICRAAEHSSV
jgi:hypothetical protein